MRRVTKAGAIVLICLLALVPEAAHAQEGDLGYSGAAVIVQVSVATRDITNGDSSTVFSFRLPTGASCPGDSANDGYRFHSFMVPVGTDVAALTYDNVRPLGDDRFLPIRTPLNDLFVHQLLAPNPQVGMPGLIPTDFALTFGGWPEPGLTAGRYKVGIACTEPERWDVVQYWDTDADVVLEIDPDGENGEIVWELEAAEAASPGLSPDGDASSSSGTLAIVAAGALGVGVLALILRRRSAQRSKPNKEIPA